MRKGFEKRNTGITLIALLVSIIVLLILAGISILMLSGENGLLTRATETKKGTDIAQIRERIRLAYHDALTDGLGTVDEPKLVNALDKEFGENNYDLDNANEEYWIVTVNKEQSIEVSENIPKPSNLSTGDTGDSNSGNEPMEYSNDVKTKLAVDTENHTTPYVEYNGNKYRVLYNDDEHGIELISVGTIGTVTLGSTDPAELALTDAGQAYVEANNITLVGTPGSTTGIDRVKWSYNNAIATLNYAAEKCRVANDGIVDSARCVGSVPNNKFTKNTAMYSRMDSWFSKYNNQFEQGEEVYSSGTTTGTPNYSTDKAQLEALNIWKIGSKYWIASRYTNYSGDAYFVVKSVDKSGSFTSYKLFEKRNGYTISDKFSLGLRPVLHLAYGVEVIGDSLRDGSTENKAYTLKVTD